jgi:hypothetical protein
MKVRKEQTFMRDRTFVLVRVRHNIVEAGCTVLVGREAQSKQSFKTDRILLGSRAQFAGGATSQRSLHRHFIYAGTDATSSRNRQ